MAEQRRALPVGLIIAAPPVLAALYLATVVALRLAGMSDPVAKPLDWFDEIVFTPLHRMFGIERFDSLGPSLGTFLLVFGSVWVGFFFVVGLVLGALAGLANVIVHRGGTGGKEG